VPAAVAGADLRGACSLGTPAARTQAGDAAPAGGRHRRGRSIGELDVAADLRRRRLPEPDRQVVRKRPSGTQYLDCEFPGYELVLEVDGAGHAQPGQRLADLLRDITEVAGGRTVIRLPLEIYYLDREAVLDRLEQVFRGRGWTGDSRAA
jgi:very-short-patch-repair endonuclease